MNIVIAGVGGQGTVLASRALAAAAVASGLDAVTSETIGMAQREGVVQSHVRIGADIGGPLIPDGGADLVLGFEPAEAARALVKVRPGARAVINIAPVYPFTVALGASRYDEAAILAYLQAALPGAVLLDATELAARAGNRRAMNAVMLGALAALGFLPLPAEAVKGALLGMVREKYREVNEKAFALGAEAAG
ncbi:MAG: indolepyruvate oxidoreductase subunit beta [Patescibacteria group bacterium]